MRLDKKTISKQTLGTNAMGRLCLKYNISLAIIAIAANFLLASCGSVKTGLQSPEQLIFRSNDYIVYKLQTRDTWAALAEKYLGDEGKYWMIQDANENRPLKTGTFIHIPLKDRNRGGLSIAGYQKVPILCYHRFAEKCASPLCMPVHLFEQQMKFLKENDYHTISTEALLDFLNYRHSIPKKSVIISIDDGYRSVYNLAYPILKKYGFTATLFIYTDYVGVSSKSITWPQLAEMKAAGFCIGSHTIAHSDLSKKSDSESESVYLKRVHRELVLSKEIIDRKLAQNTFVLAYPFGRYTRQVREMTKAAGYRLAMTVKRGGNPFFTNPHTLNREQVLKRDMPTFISYLKVLSARTKDR